MRSSLVRAGVIVTDLWALSMVRFTALVLTALAVLAACQALAESGRKSRSEQLGARYEQTWPLSYASTSCQEFVDMMTPQQRFAAAADMLTAGRDVDAATTMPTDELVGTFAEGIDRSCIDKGLSLAEVGATLYRLERQHFRP